MRLEPTELTGDEQALREEVRAFLAARLPAGSYLPGLGMAGDAGPQFSRDPGVSQDLAELAQAATLTTLCVERAGRAAATSVASTVGV